MEEEKDYIKSLAKFLGWVILLDIFTIALVGVYFLAGGKGDLHDFGEMVIGAGAIVSMIGVFIVGISHDNPRTASKLYTIRKASQSYFQENRLKKFFTEQKILARARLIVVLAGLSTILIGLGFFQFGYSPEELQKIDEFHKIEVLSAKEIFTEANKIAMSWSEKAQLISIHVPIIGPNNSTEEKDVIYWYISIEYPSEYLSIKCNGSHCTKSTYEDDFSDSPPIEFEKVQIDSIEAAQIGLENGGDRNIFRAFGTGHMTLSWYKEYPLEEKYTFDWLTSFSCDQCSSLSVHVNPYTGEVIDKE